MTKRYPTTAADDLRAYLTNSPDVGISDLGGLNVRNAGDLGAAAEATLAGATDTNALSAKFEHLWQSWGGPELTKEHRFHPHRRWRLDYYHAPTRTAVELEGGLFSGGRHTRAAGFLGDCEKYNAAAMMGITVLRLGTGQVDHQHVTEIIDWIRKQEG